MTIREEIAFGVTKYERREARKRFVRKIIVFGVFLVVLGLAYTGYKAF